MKVRLVAAVLASAAAATASPVLYVGSGGESVPATHVVVMKNGTGTSVTFMPDYVGPRKPFVVVFAVPEDVTREDLHTIPRQLFERVAHVSAPRFAEFWEQPPCDGDVPHVSTPAAPRPHEKTPHAAAPLAAREAREKSKAGGLAGTEYESAYIGELSGLVAWLGQRSVSLPNRARRILSDNAELGQKFVALAVNVDKMSFYDATWASLTPVGFSTDRELDQLPMRIGSSSIVDAHELYIHTFAPQRMDIANYASVPGPTNLLVDSVVRTRMDALYTGLIKRFKSAYRRNFVVEYAWPALGCAEPCPNPPLTDADLITLQGKQPMGGVSEYVHTRLHYSAPNALPEDPKLAPAPPLAGGQGVPEGASASLPATVTDARVNAFALRFVHAHRHRAEPACKDPRRFVWGAPPRPAPVHLPVFTADGMSRLSHYRLDPERVVLSKVPSLGLPGADPDKPVLPLVAPGPEHTHARPRGGACACRVPAAPHDTGLWWVCSVLFATLAYARRRQRG
jgi:hypothetical protein